MDLICSPDKHTGGYYGNGAPRNIVSEFVFATSEEKKKSASLQNKGLSNSFQRHYATKVCLLKLSLKYVTVCDFFLIDLLFIGQVIL